MRRRDFLKGAGCFIVGAGTGVGFGCSDSGSANASGGDGGNPGSFTFPQGVASGDPRQASVVLWTRVQAEDKKATGAIDVLLEVATDEHFERMLLKKQLQVSAASDYTLRVLVEGLKADTIYYYRYTAGSDRSAVGRTWTAPELSADATIHFAWASCQDYSAGFYGAYRRMLNDDRAAAKAEQLRFVLFIGDFIYETRGESFQMALDDELQPVDLKDRAGASRAVPEFPSGGGMLASGGTFAQTVDDYRHLYKTFLSDPDLQTARARWPFINVWDDHEFSNDCWQTQANYTNESSFDEPSQRRRVAANQAWFEFIPASLNDGDDTDGIRSPTHDFVPAKVEDVAYDTPVDVTEPNNAKAIGTLTIYRRLRFGKHVDIVLTDNRAYRSDHALPEDITDGNPVVFDPRAALPLEAVNAFDAGKDAEGGAQDRVSGYENTRKDSPPGSLLGASQKAWWKNVLQKSTASFKIWGNSLPLVRIKLDATNVALFPGDLVLSADGWDGYPSERRELMQYLQQQGIRNVISLSGDHHAHFAGVVYDDFDAASASPVMLDFCAAGISSLSQFAAVAGAIKDRVTPATKALVEPILELITYDSTPLGGDDTAVVNLNTLIRYGSGAAMSAAATHDLAKIALARNPEINPHLRYADSEANGYGLASFGADGGRITLVTIEKPVTDRGDDGAAVQRKATFELALVAEGDTAALAEPEFDGKKPFPLA